MRFFNNSPADCQAIWRKHGWTPPTEYRTDYRFAHKHGTKLNGEPKLKPGPKGPRNANLEGSNRFVDSSIANGS